jgi:hypothetical protein
MGTNVSFVQEKLMLSEFFNRTDRLNQLIIGLSNADLIFEVSAEEFEHITILQKPLLINKPGCPLLSVK